MGILDQLTLITCSYNTPEVVETMLKSFRLQHKELDKINVLIMENSTNDLTCRFLDENNIRYIRNPGGTHSRSMDCAFEMCETPYALVVDSDIVFLSNITELFGKIKQEYIDLAGIECGSRGGYNLKTRMQPWFMFVNVDSIRNRHIKFHDEERIKATDSMAFYGNIPLNTVNSEAPMYDVGATFYEEVTGAGLNVVNMPNLQSFFFHAEGMSWQRVCGHPAYEERGNSVWQHFQKLVRAFKFVNIRNFYIGSTTSTSTCWDYSSHSKIMP
jgi:hypothetical protein